MNEMESSTVVGARPRFVKAFAVTEALRQNSVLEGVILQGWAAIVPTPRRVHLEGNTRFRNIK